MLAELNRQEDTAFFLWADKTELKMFDTFLLAWWRHKDVYKGVSWGVVAMWLGRGWLEAALHMRNCLYQRIGGN